MKRDLISPAYLEEQRRLHADPRGYGGRGAKWATLVHQLATTFPVRDAILDYGCGQNGLASTLRKRGLRTRSYDPAIDDFSAAPKVSDFVVCTDVLEHVEPEKIDNVIAHLAEVTRRRLFVVVSLVPTAKTLSDGRQAHISLHPRDWWLKKLGCHFDLVDSFDAEEYRPAKQLVAVFERKRT